MPDFTIDDLRDLMRNCGIEADAPLDEAALDLSTDELGLDSLAVLQIASLIEQQTSVPIPDAAVREWLTPRRIVNDVARRLRVA